MIDRRKMLKTSLTAGISLLAAGRCAAPRQVLAAAAEPPPDYRVTRDVPARLFDGERCFATPRAGIVPGAGADGLPRVVMTMNTLDLSGSDVFKASYWLRTNDLGRTWTRQETNEPLSPRFEVIDGVRRPVSIGGLSYGWHAASRTLLGTGQTIVYTPEWKVTRPRPRHVAYANYDAAGDRFSPWRKLAMPDEPKFHDCGAGAAQRCDLADGAILLPVYFRMPGKNSYVAVARCTFDGQTLRYVEHGNEMGIDDKTRGLAEPSLVRFGGQYLLTIRNDRRGFVTRGDDGLHFEPIRPWKFDDGADLGNYNTQQHWVAHSRGLFLVYTRRGHQNDHVFRHRAPLLMAQVDPERLCVLRATERELVPERGARLGNFGVTHISPDETWVTVAEWMQPRGVERHGSDGSVYVARIHWAEPNERFGRG